MLETILLWANDWSILDLLLLYKNTLNQLTVAMISSIAIQHE